MKIQCLKCKEIVPIGAFVPSDSGIEITCAACAQTFFLPRSGEADGAPKSPRRPRPTAGSSDDPECPKCGLVVRSDSSACKSCGLLRERFESFASDAAAEADDLLDVLWESVCADWENDAAHEKFIARASTTAAYAQAARRYRDAQRDRPGDAAIEARLGRIKKMAEVALLSARPAQVEDEGPNPYRGLIILLGLILLIAVIAGFWALTKTKDTAKKRPAAVTQPASR